MFRLSTCQMSCKWNANSAYPLFENKKKQKKSKEKSGK